MMMYGMQLILILIPAAFTKKQGINVVMHINTVDTIALDASSYTENAGVPVSRPSNWVICFGAGADADV